VTYEVAEDAAATGIRHLELFWNPSDTALTYAEVTEAMSAAMQKAAEQVDIRALFIPSINRESRPKKPSPWLRPCCNTLIYWSPE
jgi:adenine deaminase